ncbi:hypothetical protein SG34_026605 [Thalassomonas viridans]|uniref:Lipoprotein n=1 Tax=Thalassomonas viridans TaxID=137584 RepID=A0AAF0C724_9GAMM|nr:hypothetical protein [Thalassomonas viridans]WDE04842.1 hypothetical protein SG34_026605 [Thalassomonas viridans]
MKQTTIAIITAALLASPAFAEQYNHNGTHSDPQITFSTGNVTTFSCGSLPISSCTSQINIEAMAVQACRDQVNDDTDPFVSINGYYHHVQQFAVGVVGATYGSPWTIDVQYSCAGLFHPGSVVIGPAPFEPAE